MPENKLIVRRSKRERDMVYDAPRKIDGMLVHAVIACERAAMDGRAFPVCQSLLAELEARGYDITTFRLTIERKAETEG